MSAKIEKRMKDRMNICKEIEVSIDLLAKKINELTDHDLKTYQMLNNPDALYNDCPISNFITYRHLKNHMIKRDMDFIGYILDGKHSVKTFTEMASEVPKWVLRFATEPVKEKIGIDAII